MPTKKDSDVVARGAEEVAAKLGGSPTRDALLDPQPTDIIPDLEEKGYHVGEVAQPAEPVMRSAGDVSWESLPEAPESKFAPTTYAEQVAANDAMQRDDPRYAGRPVETIPATEEESQARYQENLKRARSSSGDNGGSRGGSSAAASKLESDANAVASKQAREDKS